MHSAVDGRAQTSSGTVRRLCGLHWRKRDRGAHSFLPQAGAASSARCQPTRRPQARWVETPRVAAGSIPDLDEVMMRDCCSDHEPRDFEELWRLDRICFEPSHRLLPWRAARLPGKEGGANRGGGCRRLRLAGFAIARPRQGWRGAHRDARRPPATTDDGGSDASLLERALRGGCARPRGLHEVAAEDSSAMAVLTVSRFPRLRASTRVLRPWTERLGDVEALAGLDGSGRLRRVQALSFPIVAAGRGSNEPAVPRRGLSPKEHRDPPVKSLSLMPHHT